MTKKQSVVNVSDFVEVSERMASNNTNNIVMVFRNKNLI